MLPVIIVRVVCESYEVLPVLMCGGFTGKAISLMVAVCSIETVRLVLRFMVNFVIYGQCFLSVLYLLYRFVCPTTI